MNDSLVGINHILLICSSFDGHLEFFCDYSCTCFCFLFLFGKWLGVDLAGLGGLRGGSVPLIKGQSGIFLQCCIPWF